MNFFKQNKMPEKEIDLKLIEVINQIKPGYWKFQDGLINSSFRTSIDDKFDISLDLKHKEGKDPEENDYTFAISRKGEFDPVIYEGKDARLLYKLIEVKYRIYIGRTEEDKSSTKERLNEFLNK